MATVSIQFRKDRINKDGVAPLNFFIIKNRKLTKVKTGIMVRLDQWDDEKGLVKKNHPNSKRMNAYLTKKKAELMDDVLDLETKTKGLTSKQLRDRIYGKEPVNLFTFGSTLCKEYLQNGKVGTHDKTSSILNKIKKYTGTETLTLQEITSEWLYKYENYCKEILKNKVNTIHKDMRFLKTIFNRAIRMDIIEYSHFPFNKYRIKAQRTERQYLTEEELKSIEDLDLEPGSRIELHRDMFVFSAYTGGLRVSDVLQLKWKNFDGSHIHFTIRKTTAQLSIKLPAKSIAIINTYKEANRQPTDFIFPMLPDWLDMDNLIAVDAAITSSTAYINKNLKEIAKKAKINKVLSFHIARHTWATRALRKGISIDKVSKLMGHSAIRETQVYAKIVNEELDKAMDVFNI